MKDLIYSKGIDNQKVTTHSVKIQLKMRRHRFKWARIDFQLSSLNDVLLVVFISKKNKEKECQEYMVNFEKNKRI